MDLPVRHSVQTWSTAKSDKFSQIHKTQAVRVVVPASRERGGIKPVDSERVRKIVCHRSRAGVEEYLVQWATASRDASAKANGNGNCNGNHEDDSDGEIESYAWYSIEELSECLPVVQDYLERLAAERRRRGIVAGSKRKTLSVDSDESAYNTDSSRLNAATRTPSYRSDSNGAITNSAVASEWDSVVTLSMLETALHTPRRRAEYRIKSRFKQLVGAQSPMLSFRNDVDSSTPPLRFVFIDAHIYGKDVVRASDETLIGCGTGKNGCRPDMGTSVGCEYSRRCECLEYAAVDEIKLANDNEKARFEAGELEGLPKRFPYFAPSAGRAGCLTPFYMNARHVIYECNPRCNCGAGCKTRLVQKGRTIALEIFKTANRGFGLRCLEALQEGQFIDTYRGEIITDEEADRRELAAKGSKASYFFELDKHVQEDCYVIDGEMMGGPTRFMNHSCQPNCRQFTVSYNKYDIKVYHIAFFAVQDIPAGTELTFDYLDKDENDNTEQGSVLEHECRCGSAQCRKTLWH